MHDQEVPLVPLHPFDVWFGLDKDHPTRKLPWLQKAAPGDAVGFSMTLSRSYGVLAQADEAMLLLAAEEGMPLSEMPATEALGTAAYQPALAALLDFPTHLREFSVNIRGKSKLSPKTDGMKARDLWVFPRVAVALDPSYGAQQTQQTHGLEAFYVPPSSQHERLLLTNEINRALRLAEMSQGRTLPPSALAEIMPHQIELAAGSGRSAA